MTERSGPTDDGGIDRRTVLGISSGAIASGVAFTSVAGMANANNGNGNGNGRGRGRDNGNGGDDEYEVDESIVFCGCSQVCACDCPGDIVIEKDGEIERITNGLGEVDCYETDDAKILAVEATNVIWYNQNDSCAGWRNEEWEGEERFGTRPQDGARCGDAFLERCDVEQ